MRASTRMYMLDTNTVSDFLKAHPVVVQRVTTIPMHRLCISAITGGELMFGQARKPQAKQLHALVTEFLRRVDVLPWDKAAMKCYGSLRADLQQHGISLSALDLLIAAHALSTGSVLVTRDAAFAHVSQLRTQDWTLVSG